MNIFFDLGTHYGQGMRHFIKKYQMDRSWKIHTFEANPRTFKKFIDNEFKQTPWVVASNVAISDHNGTLNLSGESYLTEKGTGQGSSVIPLDKWNTNQKFIYQDTVKCIDFSQYILDNTSEGDFVVCKMDIEGSEYDVLEKMISDGSIDRITDLYVEWHSRCFRDNSEIIKREKKLKKYLEKNLSHFENWI